MPSQLTTKIAAALLLPFVVTTCLAAPQGRSQGRPTVDRPAQNGRPGVDRDAFKQRLRDRLAGRKGGKRAAPDAPPALAEKLAKRKLDPTAAAELDDLKAKTRKELRVTWSQRGAARAVYGKFGNFGGANERAARAFLGKNKGLFKLREDLGDLAPERERRVPGGTRVTYQQEYKGLKVHGGRLAVSFDTEGDVTVAGGDYFDDVALDTTEPSISAGGAQAALVAALPQQPAGDPLVNEVEVYVDEGGASHLAYHVIQPTVDEGGVAATFEGFVDAESARVIDEPHDINQYATARVFAKGNAIASTGNAALKDGAAVPDSAYATVQLQGLTSTTGLVGQFVDCVTLTAAGYRATPDASGNYAYARSTNPAEGAKFDAAMAYYFLDFTQRYVQGTLGFSNVVNRAIQVNVNGTTDDNSFYTATGGGLGTLTLGSGGVDDGEDAEAFIHEYGHAIQDSSTPGIWRTNGSAGTVARTGAMGEGFGDYWAASVVAQHFQQAGTPFETSVMEWDASAYSASNPPSIRSITSPKHYPQDVVGEVHTDGEIWASTLWQIRGDLGPVAADRAILQAHFLVNSANATFTDGANAILAAADALGYPQTQKNQIRARFEQRGILTPVDTGGATNPTGTGPGTDGTGTTTGGTTAPPPGPGCTSTTTALAPGSTVNGSLATTDCFGTVGKSMYHDKFTVAATAGTPFTVTMTSSAFDTYLVLKDPAGGTAAQDDDGAGGSNSKLAFTPSATGTYTVEATSYDARATGSYTVSMAGAAPAPPTQQPPAPSEIVTNGGFEAGASGWTQSPAGIVASSGGVPARTGTYKAAFLGRGVTGTASIWQAPAFPASGGARTLRFYLRIVSDETGSVAYDKIAVRVQDQYGTNLATLATFSNANKSTYANWALVTVAIPASLAVQGNRIRFTATEDSMVATAFYVDDVSIQ